MCLPAAWASASLWSWARQAPLSGRATTASTWFTSTSTPCPSSHLQHGRLRHHCGRLSDLPAAGAEAGPRQRSAVPGPSVFGSVAGKGPRGPSKVVPLLIAAAVLCWQSLRWRPCCSPVPPEAVGGVPSPDGRPGQRTCLHSRPYSVLCGQQHAGRRCNRRDH